METLLKDSDILSSFPDEMLLTIFIGLGLDLADLLNIFAVCKRWNQLSELIFSRIYIIVMPSTPAVHLVMPLILRGRYYFSSYDS
jgi:hypothetical protein